jgi:hypothetical protein
MEVCIRMPKRMDPMLEKGGVHDRGKSTIGRCCTRKRGFGGGGRVHGESAKRGT